ncbi:MAG: hypothetical protein CMH32_05515 [Micavibrio sp.]|nr:hypothetical protein [Micavibrio sp.]
MKEKKFITITAFVCLLIMSLIAGVNYVVDPYGIYDPPHIEGVNGHYPSALSFSRLFKAEAMKRVKPDVAILGTSVADVGLNPEGFFPDGKAYNFAVSGASIEEQYYNLKYAFAVNPPELVILTLDFFIYDANRLLHNELDLNRFKPNALKPVQSFFNSYGTLLSLDTFRNSLQHLRRMKHPERYSYPRKNGHNVHQKGAYFAKHKGFYPMFVKPPAPDMMASNDYRFDYPVPEKHPVQTSFGYLEMMLELARGHGAEVILFLSPMHQKYLRVLEDQGNLAKFHEWHDRVIETVVNHNKKYDHNYALWDFSAKHPYTNEPIPAEGDTKTQMKYFWDVMHYQESLGDIIFKKILNKKDGSEDKNFRSFGKKIN